MHAPDKQGSGVYALGFDDPTGLQSQASTVLAPALTLTQGSGAAELHTILDSMETGPPPGLDLLIDLSAWRPMMI